jgi:hypothetical protein
VKQLGNGDAKANGDLDDRAERHAELASLDRTAVTSVETSVRSAAERFRAGMRFGSSQPDEATSAVLSLRATPRSRCE